MYEIIDVNPTESKGQRRISLKQSKGLVVVVQHPQTVYNDKQSVVWPNCLC